MECKELIIVHVISMTRGERTEVTLERCPRSRFVHGREEEISLQLNIIEQTGHTEHGTGRRVRIGTVRHSVEVGRSVEGGEDRPEVAPVLGLVGHEEVTVEVTVITQLNGKQHQPIDQTLVPTEDDQLGKHFLQLHGGTGARTRTLVLHIVRSPRHD